jgi:hypothetical protein
MRPLFDDRKACSQVNHYHLMQAMSAELASAIHSARRIATL